MTNTTLETIETLKSNGYGVRLLRSQGTTHLTVSSLSNPTTPPASFAFHPLCEQDVLGEVRRRYCTPEQVDALESLTLLSVR